MTQEKTIRPEDVAGRYGVGIRKVIQWIVQGELGAVNVAATPGKRPRYRIRTSDLVSFEMRRGTRTASAAPAIPRIRRPALGSAPSRY